MHRASYLCLVLLVAAGWRSAAALSPNLDMAMSVVDMALQSYEYYKALQHALANPTSDADQLTFGDVQIMDELKTISDNLIHLQQEILDYVIRKLPTQFGNRAERIFDSVDKINEQYNLFLDTVFNETGLEDVTLADRAQVFTTSSLEELSTAINTMYKKYMNDVIGDKSIVSILTNQTNEDLMCSESQTPYQLLLYFYDIVVTSDAKALVMKFYGYDLYTKLDKTRTFKTERAFDIRHLNERVNRAYKKTKDALPFASRELHKCDPTEHIPTQTYSYLKRVFQAHIMDQRDHDDYTGSGLGNCGTSCKLITDRMLYGRPGIKSTGTYNGQLEAADKRCSGLYTDCDSTASKLTVCYANSTSDRNLEWITMADTESKYGLYSGDCDDHEKRLLKADTGYFGQIIHPCGFCLCTCLYEDKYADRYFSLGRAISDVDDNKVVTGVRFRLIDHVFYIQIKQGVLGANGTIDPTTNDWKDIEDTVKIFKDLYETNPTVYTVKHDQKTVYLDDIEPKSNTSMVVTGIKFSRINKSLRLKVEMMPFDYKTGKLYGRNVWMKAGTDYSDPTSEWNNWRDPFDGRTELKLTKPHMPILRKNTKLSSSGQYVEFRTTDRKQDLGQNTIPFIDLQQIETNPPVPMAGAGVYLKYAEGSGGFLGLKLFQYNDYPHV